MFYGERVVFSGLELADLDEIMKHWNDYEIREFLMNHMPHSREQEEEWIRSSWSDRMKQKGYMFKMTTERGNFLGTCGLGSISPIHQSATLGIAITNKNFWNQGYGTDAMRLLISIGFHILNLHRIQLEVHDFNERARSVYKKVGFKEVGKKRQAYFIYGRYVDAILMDILDSEYHARYDQPQLGEPSPWKFKSEPME